jgi:hypothetical protein
VELDEGGRVDAPIQSRIAKSVLFLESRSPGFNDKPEQPWPGNHRKRRRASRALNRGTGWLSLFERGDTQKILLSLCPFQA